MNNTAVSVTLTIVTPLAGSLLYAWDHAGTVEGELALGDALRLDTQRAQAKSIPSVGITLDLAPAWEPTLGA